MISISWDWSNRMLHHSHVVISFRVKKLSSYPLMEGIERNIIIQLEKLIMLIAATSDVLSPRFFPQFVSSLEKLQQKPDLFLMAGDMIYRGAIEEYEKVHNALFGKITCPIVACFGNNEYQPIRDKLKQRFRDIRFLDDQSILIRAGKVTVGVFGTTGALDTPTPWQKANIPNIEKIFQMRYNMADKHLERMKVGFRILLSHYAPTYKTLEGENPRYFSSMGSQVWENILVERKPDLVVHGHSLRGSRLAWVDTVPVVNVALPLNRGIVLINTEQLKPGLQKFV